jgi:hypothetical protein
VPDSPSLDSSCGYIYQTSGSAHSRPGCRDAIDMEAGCLDGQVRDSLMHIRWIARSIIAINQRGAEVSSDDNIGWQE